MEEEIYYKPCYNCGNTGHEYKKCMEPIISFGIIDVKIIIDGDKKDLINKYGKDNSEMIIYSKKYSHVKYINNINSRYNVDNKNILLMNNENLKKILFYKDKILFLLVSRKFSLGFIEFIKGRYNLYEIMGIVKLFKQMYKNEIDLIKDNDYDSLLYIFLNKNENKETFLKKIYTDKHKTEYLDAKFKFNILKNNTECVMLNIDFLVNNIKPKWRIPEWGFPKGRKSHINESNLICAKREFQEESGYNAADYQVLNMIEPIEELLIGTNGIKYKHVYYLALDDSHGDLKDNNYDNYEIGSIKWFTYDEAISVIRPHHNEKKQILTKIYLFILNFLCNKK